MGRGFKSHKGHRWCQEGHPTTLLLLCYNDKKQSQDPLRKNSNSEVLTGYGDFEGTWVYYCLSELQYLQVLFENSACSCGVYRKHDDIHAPQQQLTSGTLLREGLFEYLCLFLWTLGIFFFLRTYNFSRVKWNIYICSSMYIFVINIMHLNWQGERSMYDSYTITDSICCCQSTATAK